RDPARELGQRGGTRTERRQRGDCQVDQLSKARARARDAMHGDQRRLAAGGILGGRLAGSLRGGRGVDQVVGELEGAPQQLAVAGQRIALAGGGATEERAGVGGVAEQRDRKSTRLNSSHLGISYAV